MATRHGACEVCASVRRIFVTIAGLSLAGCSTATSRGRAIDATSMAPEDSADSANPDANRLVDGMALPPPPFVLGMAGQTSELVAYTTFRTANHTPASEPRLCHVYTYWDIAEHDPAGGTGSHTLAGLVAWLVQAQGVCEEAMITFQGPQLATSTTAPSVAAFEQAFLAFLAVPEVASWQGKLSFTAWNEPNNPGNAGNGLQSSLSPELAAQYYLVLREHCDPMSGCKLAAGDFATNGNFWNDLEWNCANDNDPANTPTHCAASSSENPTHAPPSYLDRYKNYIAIHATDFGLPSGFRPEFMAYHPWHDVNNYINSNAPCSTYQNCATRRLLTSLGGTWGGVEIWDNEVGVGLQNATPPDENTTQPCGAAFLVRLTELDPRITRVYYMHFGSSNGPLLDGNTLRPAGIVLGTRSGTYAGATCAATGLPAP